MIIECINCKKKFNVDSALIPKNGRNIQCGSCNKVWFYKNKETNFEQPEEKIIINEKIEKVQKNKSDEAFLNKNNTKKLKTIRISNILSILIVFIITFISIILLLDTFKFQLTPFFPNLELILFNLFETLNDIFLFVKNLLF